MISQEHIQTIEHEARNFFEKFEPLENLVVGQQEGEDGATVTISVQITEPKMLIGEKGQTLFEIQHILKLILRRKVAEPFYLSFDVNDYKKNKEEYLRDLAKTTADEVVLLKREKELPAMPSAERRVVHMALAERSDVTSDSVGEGADRRVVVRQKN